MMKYLVTGGAGFIGSHLTSRLVEDGHKVLVLDNLSTGSLENLAHVEGRFEFIEGDLLDRETVERAVDDVEVVFHQAALASVPRSVELPLENTSRLCDRNHHPAGCLPHAGSSATRLCRLEQCLWEPARNAEA